jgi:hypothetical protein
VGNAFASLFYQVFGSEVCALIIIGGYFYRFEIFANPVKENNG